MQSVAIGILVVVTAWIIAMPFFSHYRGTVPLVSMRNLTLVGFFTFQSLNGIIHLSIDDYGEYPVDDPASSGLTFALMCFVFNLVYLNAYHLGWGVKHLARLLPTPKKIPADSALLAVATVLVVTGIALRLGVRIPLISVLANMLGTGFLCISAGIAGWVWVRRLMNPLIAGVALPIIGLAGLASMVGTFGRRALVGVILAIGWGMFYSRLRYFGLGRILTLLTVVAIPGAIVLGLFTAVRSPQKAMEDPLGMVTDVVQKAVSPEGVASAFAPLGIVFDGQRTAAVALFVIENYPENFQRPLLFGTYYAFVLPVPRGWWPDKPTPITMEIARNAEIPGVNWDGITLTCGVIGEAASEGGWLAVVVYAAFWGLFIRFFDQVVRLNPHQPFVLLSIGAGLGQIMGFFRGSVPNFANIYMLTFGTTYASAVIINALIGQRVADRASALEPGPDEAAFRPPTDGDGEEDPLGALSSPRSERADFGTLA